MKTVCLLVIAISVVFVVSCAQEEHKRPQKKNTKQEGRPLEGETFFLRNIPGEFLRAFMSAHEAFMADTEIPPQKKKIQSYEVSFAKESGLIKIYFSAKRRPGEIESLGGESELGKDVYYLVGQDDFKIRSKKFMK
jgi:hypothetical protein